MRDWMTATRSRLYGPDDKPLEPPTLLDYARESGEDGRILPIVEALTKRNHLLEDKPWQARISRIFDANGRPYLVVIK